MGMDAVGGMKLGELKKRKEGARITTGSFCTKIVYNNRW